MPGREFSLLEHRRIMAKRALLTAEEEDADDGDAINIHYLVADLRHLADHLGIRWQDVLAKAETTFDDDQNC